MSAEAWRTIRVAIRVVGLVAVTWIIANNSVYLAKEGVLKIDVIVSTLINIAGTVYVSWAITGAAIIYALRQRNLRRENTKFFAPLADNKHKEYWPDKTSSGINKDGSTRKEDKQ